MKTGIVFLLTAWSLLGQTVVNGSRSIVGAWDASGAVSTKPAKSGTQLPASCSVGAQFFKTDATAGQNLYLCTSTNTWTQNAGLGFTPENSANKGQPNGYASLGADGKVVSSLLPTLSVWIPYPSGSLAPVPALTAANKIKVGGVILTVATTFSNIVYRVTTADATGAYDVGLYSFDGTTLLAHTGVVTLTLGSNDVAKTGGGSVTLQPGKYLIAWTGNATVGILGGLNSCATFVSAQEVTTTSSGGVLPASIVVPTSVWNLNGTCIDVAFHN